MVRIAFDQMNLIKGDTLWRLQRHRHPIRQRTRAQAQGAGPEGG